MGTYSKYLGTIQGNYNKPAASGTTVSKGNYNKYANIISSYTSPIPTQTPTQVAPVSIQTKPTFRDKITSAFEAWKSKPSNVIGNKVGGVIKNMATEVVEEYKSDIQQKVDTLSKQKYEPGLKGTILKINDWVTIPTLEKERQNIELKKQQGIMVGENEMKRLDLINKVLEATPEERAKHRFEVTALTKDIKGQNLERSVYSGLIAGIKGTVGGYEWISGKDTEASKNLTEWEKIIRVENPSMADQLASAVGTSLPFYAIGGSFGLGAKAFFGSVSPKLGALLMAAGASVSESTMEAGMVYQTNLDDGKSKEEASQKADHTFLANVALNFITDRFGIFGEEKLNIKKAILSTSLEGLQEWWQQLVSNYNTGRPLEEGLGTSALFGSLLGFGMGSITGELSGNKANVKPGGAGEKETVTLYNGANKKVTKVEKTYEKVLDLQTDQAELIKRLAEEGNEDAKALYDSMPNKERVDYTVADPIIQKAYEGQFDAIKYENTNKPQVGVEFHDLKEGKFYAVNEDTAKVYALESRDLKFKPTTEKVDEKAQKIEKEEVDKPEAKEEVKLYNSKGNPVITGNPKFENKEMYGLKVGDQVNQIGVPGRNGKVTTSHSVQKFDTPVVYRGIVNNVPGLKGRHLAFEYTEKGKKYYLLYSPTAKDYMITADPKKLTSRQYKAVFNKVASKTTSPKALKQTKKKPVAQKTVKKQAKPSKPEATEAKKYKSAGEFIKENIKVPKDVVIPKVEYTNFSSGQSDGYIPAYNKNGKKIGFVDFTDYDGKVEVRMIKVDEKYRGQGIAKALLSKLEKEFPDSKLVWSVDTKDGESLKLSYDKTKQQLTDIWNQSQSPSIPEVKTDTKKIEAYIDSKKIKFRTDESIVSSKNNDLIILKSNRKPTIKFLEHPEIKNKKEATYAYLQQIANSGSLALKQAEKDVIKYTLETVFPEYKTNGKKINIEELRTEITDRLLPLETIKTDTYATYGSDAVNLSYGTEKKTYLLNSPYEHGKTGHFGGDFDFTIKENELEIKEIPPQEGNPTAKYAVIKKGVVLTEENIEENVYQLANTKEEAQKFAWGYIADVITKKDHKDAEKLFEMINEHTGLLYDNQESVVHYKTRKNKRGVEYFDGKDNPDLIKTSDDKMQLELF